MLIYRLIVTFFLPFAAWRLWREAPEDRQERLGAKGTRAPIWLHGASNGELTAAKPLIDALLEDDPALTVMITCNSLTARAMVRGWDNPRIAAQLAPLDLRWVLKRFLRSVDPSLLIIIENELWPNRLAMMQARGGRVAVISARMSENSATKWARMPGVAAQIMGLIDMLCAQDAASQARFAALGVDKGAIGPTLNLKSRTTPGTFDVAQRDAYARHLLRKDTVLAASTHPGEENLVLEAFQSALTYRPELRLILAPRHPKRGDSIAQMIAAKGLKYTRRSKGDAPTAQVYLADTLGEMPLWYELSSLCFVGGSLVPNGGHTPYEPIAHGCAVLHGPHLENYTESYAALTSAGATMQVTNAPELTRAVLALDTLGKLDLATKAREVAAERHAPAQLAPVIARLRALKGD